MFSVYGDLQSVKQSSKIFWVDFEEFTDENDLSAICSLAMQQHPHLLVAARLHGEAIRYPNQ